MREKSILFFYFIFRVLSAHLGRLLSPKFLFSQRDVIFLLSLLAYRLFLSEQQEVMDGVFSVLSSHEDVLMLVVHELGAQVIESAVLKPRTSLIEAPPFYVP